MCRVRTGTGPDQWRDDGPAAARTHGAVWATRNATVLAVAILPPRPVPGDPRLTERQREILAAVIAADGNRSHAARRLGCNVRNVQILLRSVTARGVAVPAGVVGRRPGSRDLRPRRAAAP